MTKFVGREAEFAELERQLRLIEQGNRLSRGVAVSIRGRRRVGKSALVTEFIRRTGLPSIYFQAARNEIPAADLRELMKAVAESGLPVAEVAGHATPSSLTEALRLLAMSLPDDQPTVVVLDELPWLLERFSGGAGELQRVWDRELSAKPVLLLLLGSDLSLMEAFGGHDQPFYGRAVEMILRELNPRDVSRATGLEGIDAFDAYLVTGGQPTVVAEWMPHQSVEGFIADSFISANSALVASGGRVLDHEFPEVAQARSVLRAIGGRGERTWTRIQSTCGLSQTTLERALALLSTKRVVAAEEPLSLRPTPKTRRWRIDDPALRFWLAFVDPALGEIDRRRPDLATARFCAGWSAWRGRSVESVVRDALNRLLPDESWPDVQTVGGWWPRNNTPEIDLVGADAKAAKRVELIGTIKWRERQPVSADEITDLRRDGLSVPGVNEGTPLVAVCPAGAVPDHRLSATWNADDLLNAWP